MVRDEEKFIFISKSFSLCKKYIEKTYFLLPLTDGNGCYIYIRLALATFTTFKIENMNNLKLD